MKPVSRAFVISALVIGLAVVSTAQSRATNRVANTKVPVPTALSTETFTFATPHESWALGDPLPTKDVAFDGAPLSLMMRRVQVRPSDTGGTELVYPIAGIAFYQHDDVNISYVVARYEQGHCVVALDVLKKGDHPVFADYRRTFARDEGHSSPPFDVLTEAWFWTEDDYRHFLALHADPRIGAILAEDEAALFDRASITIFAADEHISASAAQPIL